MGKGKLQKFEENTTFSHVFQPEYEETANSFFLKGKWAKECFRNSNPVILELACGKGEYTIGLAQRNPQFNYIGIDVKGSRMWRGAKTAAETGLSNVAFLRIQIDQITNCFSKDEISQIWITFPDPHPRESRYRRRLTSHKFLRKYKELLVDDGIIHLKTDNVGLFDNTLEIINEGGHKLLFSTRDVYKTNCPEEVLNIQTFYEKMFLAQNMPIHYLNFRLK